MKRKVTEGKKRKVSVGCVHIQIEEMKCKKKGKDLGRNTNSETLPFIVET